MTRPRPVERRRPEPRHTAEKPLFEFNLIAEQLMKEVQTTVDKHGLTLKIGEPKYKSKLRTIAKGIVKQPFKDILANKWLPGHPIKLAGEVVLTKKGGLLKFRRDKSNAKKIKALNAKYAPEVEAMSREYEAEARAALQELMTAVNSGKVNERNRNNYFRKYQQQVLDAQTKFKQRELAVTQNFGKEFAGKWV